MKAYILTPKGRRLTVLNVSPWTTIEQIKIELRKNYGMRADLYELFTGQDELLDMEDNLQKLMISKVDDFVDMFLVFSSEM